MAFVVTVVPVGWRAVQKVTGEDSFSIQMAFGIPHDGAIEMYTTASMGMTASKHLVRHPLEHYGRTSGSTSTSIFGRRQASGWASACVER